MTGGPVGIGLLGCGAIAYWSHLPVLRRLRGARLVAAADPDPRARGQASRAAGVPVLASSDELLAHPDVEAVVISAPTGLHAGLAKAAAGAGKHFYLEKPIATTVADARQVVDLAARGGVRAAIGFNRRMHPLHRQARGLLRAGRIGRVRAVQTSFCEPTPVGSMPDWKRTRATGGGVLLDLASHHVDLVHWFLDEEIAAVAASTHSEESDHDSARLELTTATGVEVQSWFSFRTGLADHLEFHGERGTLRVDRHSPRLVLRAPRRLGYGVREHWIRPTGEVAKWRLLRRARPSVDPSYRAALQAFVDHVRGGPVAPASLLDGMRSLEVVLGAESSAESAVTPRSGPPVAVACASS